jgi:dihydropteroate synthase
MSPAELVAFMAGIEPGGLGHRPAVTQVMAVVNTTPDSFSDGGEAFTAGDAAEAVRRHVDAGADLVDIGGESTRPGSEPVAAAQQIRRVLPAIEAAVRLGVAASVDTSSAEVARAALDAGAAMVNDVTGGRGDPALLPLVGERGVPIVLMHMRGTPRTMQDNPRYDDVTRDVLAMLDQQREAATAVGGRHVVLDPGIGFGKTLDHNLTLLRDLPRFVAAGPTLLGASRKSFLGKLTGEPDAARRDAATDATTAHAARCGAAFVRVHNTRNARHVVDVTRALSGG